ncbi:glycoside hydrolase family 79 protein [Dichomitus squalens]|uniref:Glycoside hydrolase family 79 protein n=1 Tax=Dichomitus squalens TaxID=114155 RepID=A0A4Q9P0K7_9APHY|nr:glycoside hydrolase family 79 protein [Dichomitus squalens]TBU58421.1 glycoside hydrolase family 79 protein [Dichomitus squalens]
MRRCSRLLAAAALAFHLCGSYAVNVSLPITSPSGTQPLARTLVSFSIEQDRWPDWSGVDSRNEFTHSALTALQELTGEPPKIRIGADSEDHTFWSPTVTINEDEFPPANTITPYPEATHITVGDAYYQLSRFLPRGTHVTWGINFGADNVTNAVNMAKAIVRAFQTAAVKASGVILDLVEVGNEADLYSNNGLRPRNFTVNDYVPDWISIAGPAVEAAGINGPDGPVTVQGAAFAGQGFTPTEIFNLGILDSAPGKAITQISQHRYSAAFCQGGDFPLTSFLNKQYIRGNLSVFEADIAETHSRGLTYVLGETNSIACHGAPGVSNTAGAALWTIDYTLQAATLGIKELFFHEGVGYKYNFIQPVSLNRSTIDGSPLDPPSPPHIQPPFYAALVVNTAIGGTGASRLVELAVGDANVSGYAVFEAGLLVRAVFVNLHAWLASSTGARPAVHVDLDFALGGGATRGELDAFWGREATARRLVIGHADDVANLTWAGQSYENGGVAPTGRVAAERIKLSEGFDIRSTEAVLVDFVTL